MPSDPELHAVPGELSAPVAPVLVVADVRVALPDERLVGPALVRWARVPRASEAAHTAHASIIYEFVVAGAQCTAWRDGEAVYTAGLDDVQQFLELDVYREVAYASALTPLHAATVVHEGRALLLVGASGAGKSSAALALAERDFAYAGDEHAFLDDDLRVTGWPRAVRVDHVDGERVPERIAPGRSPVALVVLLARPRAPGARPRPVPPAEALARLVEALHRRPRAEDLRRLAALTGRVPVVRLELEGVDATAAALRALWGDPA